MSVCERRNSLAVIVFRPADEERTHIDERFLAGLGPERRPSSRLPVPTAREKADPWPDIVPASSQNVPTYRTTQQRPETARHQLDFASASLSSQVSVRALNKPDPEEWGPATTVAWRLESQLLACSQLRQGEGGRHAH